MNMQDARNLLESLESIKKQLGERHMATEPLSRDTRDRLDRLIGRLTDVQANINAIAHRELGFAEQQEKAAQEAAQEPGRESQQEARFRVQQENRARLKQLADEAAPAPAHSRGTAIGRPGAMIVTAQTWFRELVYRELAIARRTHAPIRNLHEGYAVIAEEIDEAWDAIKANSHGHAIIELVQAAAMCQRVAEDTANEPIKAVADGWMRLRELKYPAPEPAGPSGSGLQGGTFGN